MFNISSFLNKFSNDINNSEIQRLEIIRVIKEVSNIDINLDNIEIKDLVVYIKASPVVKNALFINKNKIIDKVAESGINIIDIK